MGEVVYLVELGEEGGWGERGPINGYRVTLLEVDLDVGGLVRGLLWGDTPGEHALRWLHPGVLQGVAATEQKTSTK